MRYLTTKIAALIVGLVPVCVGLDQAAASIIDFEDFDNSTFNSIPAGYHGFTWSGALGSGSWVVSPESANIFPGTEAHSQTHYAWSNGGNALSLSDGNFNFNSLWARIGNVTSGNGVATAHGFDASNNEIYTQTLQLTQTYQLYNLNFVGIKSWTLTDQTTNVLIDDINVTSDAAITPEPASLAIWGGIGIAGLVAGWRRKRTLAAKANA